MNRVRVMIWAKVGGKYPYLPAVVNGNGRIKPGVALVGGVERKVQGSYLRFTEGGYRRSESVGDDAAEAMTAARRIEATLKAKALDVPINPSFPDMPTKRSKLADAIAEYKSEVKEHKAKGTYNAYSCALKLFVKNCHKTFVG